MLGAGLRIRIFSCYYILGPRTIPKKKKKRKAVGPLSVADAMSEQV